MSRCYLKYAQPDQLPLSLTSLNICNYSNQTTKHSFFSQCQKLTHNFVHTYDHETFIQINEIKLKRSFNLFCIIHHLYFLIKRYMILIWKQIENIINHTVSCNRIIMTKQTVKCLYIIQTNKNSTNHYTAVKNSLHFILPNMGLNK